MHATRTIAVVAAAVSAVTALLVAGVTLAWANHAYPDHPDNNPFHEEVGNFADAGCATGFPDGTFRGHDGVKRQQMARFINACGGRIDFENGRPDGPVTDEFQTIFTVEMEAGALGDGGGFGHVDVWVQAHTNSTEPTDFPCQVEFRSGVGGANWSEWLDIDASSLPEERVSGTVQVPTLIAAGDEASALVEVRMSEPCGAEVEAFAAASFTYFPFDGSGAGGGSYQ